MAAQRIFAIRAVGGRRFRQWALLTIVLSAVLLESPPGQRLESAFGLRSLYQTRGALPPPRDVVLVTMDDAAANALGAEIGVESWPRTLHACLIDKLKTMGAAIIVMDVNFESGARHDPAPETYAPAVRANCAILSDDAGTRQLGIAVGKAGNVLLASYLGQREDEALQMTLERMPPPQVAAGALGIAPSPLPDLGERFRSYYTFRPALGADGSAGLETPSLAAMAVQAFELASLAALDTALGVAKDTAGARPDLRAHMGAIRHRVATDAVAGAAVTAVSASLGQLYGGTATPMLNIVGPPGALAELPYDELLAANSTAALAARVAGKAVFVGAAEHHTNSRIDSYLTDYPTRPGQKYGGVELVATAFANLREGRTLERCYAWQEVMLLAVLGGLLATASWRWDPVRVLPAAVAAGIAYLAIAHRLFAQHGLWLPQVVPVMVEMPLLLVGGTLLQYLHSRSLWQEAVNAAASYVSPRAREFHQQAKLVHGTVLATDVANFTPLVESYGADPRAFVALLNRYFDAISAPIANAAPPGTIIDTAGDGLLAVWDEPAEQRASRLAACLGALGIRDAVLQFNHEYPNTPMPTRIGLHAGDLAMGEIDVRQLRFVKAVGHVTNTAARIEALNKHLGTTLLASTAVVAGLEDVLLLRPCGDFLLPGRREAIGVVEVMGLLATASARNLQLAKDFGLALGALRNRQWDAARTVFESLLAEFPNDGPARFLRARCGETHMRAAAVGSSMAIMIETK